MEENVLTLISSSELTVKIILLAWKFAMQHGDRGRVNVVTLELTSWERGLGRRKWKLVMKEAQWIIPANFGRNNKFCVLVYKEPSMYLNFLHFHWEFCNFSTMYSLLFGSAFILAHVYNCHCLLIRLNFQPINKWLWWYRRVVNLYCNYFHIKPSNENLIYSSWEFCFFGSFLVYWPLLLFSC